MRFSDRLCAGSIVGTLHIQSSNQSILSSVRKERSEVDILGVQVYPLTRPQLSTKFSQLVQQGQRCWISYVNIHAIVLAHHLPWFAEYLNQSAITYCDGQGVRFGGWIIRKKIPERIVMADWIQDVFSICEATGHSVFLLGASPAVISSAAGRIAGRYPRLSIAGYHHGFFRGCEERVLKLIQAAQPDVVIVGMGMPLQEDWILNNFGRSGARIFLNGGACFEYLSGSRERCPLWMGRFGGEWIFRLFQEPGRLWKRYLIGNPWFLFRLLKSLVR